MTTGADISTTRRPPVISVTPAMVQALIGTRGWIMFLSIVGWFCGIVVILAGIGLFLFSFVNDAGQIFRAIALPYTAAGILALVPAILLTRYLRAVRRLEIQKNEASLAEALHHERRLWKFTAIASLIAIGLVVAAILIAILIPLFKAL